MKEQKIQTETKKNNKIPNTPFRFFWYVTVKSHSVRYAVIATLAVTIAGVINQFFSYFLKLIIDSAESGNMSNVWVFGLAFPVMVLFVQMIYRISG